MLSLNMNRKKIIGLQVSTLPYDLTVSKIVNLAKTKTPSYVCFANVHMAIEAYDDKIFQDQVNKANIVCADGSPLTRAIILLYGRVINRVAGMDMLPSLIHQAANESLNVFFFGTTDEILDKVKERAVGEFPHLSVVGTFSPPFKENMSSEEKQEQIDLINNSGANMVFVALGCPKQEKWMAENSPKINAVLLGVGGAFPTYANIQKRAPRLIRVLSLEWVFRLIQEPGRLLKRYLYTNSKFLALFIVQFFSKKR